MTYAAGDLVQATDINSLVSTGTPNFNQIWSTGATNSGYGQTALATVVAGAVVAQSPWNGLVANITATATHQGTTITAYTPPVTGNIVTWLADMTTNLTAINTNRLSAAAQGTTVTRVSTTTGADTWTSSLVYTFTAQFTNNNAARYFFNAGGQLAISATHPNGPGINGLFNALCANAGTVYLSSPTSGTATIAGVAYNGITKRGGSFPAGATINTNRGFYAQTTTSTEVFRQVSDFNYPSHSAGTNMTINMAYNGTGTVTIVVSFVEVPFGQTVSVGTSVTLSVINPSTAQLTNTWGTPVLASSYVVTSPVFYPLSNSTTDPTNPSWRVTQPGYVFTPSVGITMTSPITQATNMFNTGTTSTFNDPDISTWNTSSFINMSGMFRDATAFNQNLNNWDTANVTNMNDMFNGATEFNGNIANWNTSNVTNMNGMFNCVFSPTGGKFNQPIGNWNISKVTSLSGMFGGQIDFNQDISGWNTSNVTNMITTFSAGGIAGGGKFNQPIGSWNTSKVTNMTGVFINQPIFNQPLGGWNTANVTGMLAMFQGATAFNGNIGSWSVSNVTNVDNMFVLASSFNQNLSSWVTGLTAQPADFSTAANATFADNANNRKPFLQGGTVRINT